MSYTDFGLDVTKKTTDMEGVPGKLLCLWCNLNVQSGFSLCFSNFTICPDCLTELNSVKRLSSNQDCFKCRDSDISGYRIHNSLAMDLYICQSCVKWGNSILCKNEVRIEEGDRNTIIGGPVDNIHIAAVNPDARYILYITGEMNEKLEPLYEVYTAGGVINGELACIDQITLEDATLNITLGNHTII